MYIASSTAAAACSSTARRRDAPDGILRTAVLGKEKNVSISVGYACTDEIGRTDFKKPLNEAGRKMCARKERIHAGN